MSALFTDLYILKVVFNRAGSRSTSLVYCKMQYTEFPSVAHRSTSYIAYIKTDALDGEREGSLGAFFTMRKRPYSSLVFVGSYFFFLFCFVVMLFFSIFYLCLFNLLFLKRKKLMNSFRCGNWNGTQKSISWSV